MNWDWEKLKKNQKENRHQGSGGGGVPPEMDEFVNKFKEFKFSAGPIIIVILLIIAFIGSSMVYKVEPDEVGIIQLFGKYARTASPG